MAGGAELWLVDLDAAAPALEALEREEPRLHRADRLRVRQLRDPIDRRRRLAVYAALRILLERSGGSHLRRRPIVRAAGGRPRLAVAGPAFSIAHDGGLALIGVGTARAIGVDLESTREIAMSKRRREEILAVGSGLAVPALLEAGGDAAVLQAWCRLEACAKACGKGVSSVLGDLGLRKSGGRDMPLPAIAIAARDWVRRAGLLVSDVKLPAGLHGALATVGGVVPKKPRRFPTERRAIAQLLRT